MSQLRRVGLNLLFLVPGETGGREVYARSLVPRLAEASGLELVAFVNREAASALDPAALGAEVIPVDVSGRARVRTVLAENRQLPKLARNHRVDLLHSLGSTAPSLSGAVTVVTIHDLIYARHPEAHTRAMRIGMRILVPRAARSADRIIAISLASAADISSLLGVSRERIDVVYLGGKEIRAATPEEELRSHLGLGTAPIVLSVSARRPHKNLPRLLAAFARLDAEPAPLLVLPGYPTGFEGELEAEVRRLGISDRVRFLAWVSDEDLESLYAAATCFIFPSLYEGFGMPVLEAMERGVPVACSDASSLPEVAGDAARYFDPLDVEGIHAALADLIGNAQLREKLASAGRQRAGMFSWERAARDTVACYERAWAERSGSAESDGGSA